MSKTTSKKSSVKPKVSAKKKTVAAKSTPAASKAKSTKVTIDRNVLLFLVLTLVLAGIMLVVQAQTNNTLNEQNKAQQALENESSVKYDNDMKADEKAKP